MTMYVLYGLLTFGFCFYVCCYGFSCAYCISFHGHSSAHCHLPWFLLLFGLSATRL